jgi:hypothetical protein
VISLELRASCRGGSAAVFAKARSEIKRSRVERYSLPSCARKETRKLSGTRQLENRSISVELNSWDILRGMEGLALTRGGAPAVE